ncbi:unnamed protein product [Brassica rapa subsp. trilocularis]|uniref:Secreted protein n=1 Tax=Brassica campestris TaxID=3711 RepID=M4DB92_BRACM
MASSVLLGWLCLRHAMASKAPFMAGLSFNFHRSSPISVAVDVYSNLELSVPVECSIRHPTVILEPVKSTASLLLNHLVLLCLRQGMWLCFVFAEMHFSPFGL